MALLRRSVTKRIAGFATLALISACVEPGPTETFDPQLRAARPSGGGSTTGPTVKSTSPSSSVRDVTLDVRVLGSGFDQGSKAEWAIDGVPSPKVITNSTRFVNSGELVANITIAADAEVTLYDVIVTTSSGKPGIGTETFEVIIEQSTLPTVGGTSGDAYAVNDQGVIVGAATDRSADRNGTSYPVRWNFVGGKWVITKLASASSKDAFAADVNGSSIIVGFSNGRAMVWLPDGSTTDLGPGCARGINDAGTIVGVLATPEGQQGVVWTRSGSGWNPPQVLPRTLVPTSWGAWPLCGYPTAKNINNSGIIVGTALMGQDTPAAWVPQTPTGPWGEPTLPLGAVNGSATSINESGYMVGNVGPEWVPTVYLTDGTRTAISRSGPTWPTGFSFGINNSGDVVARDNGMAVWFLAAGAATWTKLSRTGNGEVRDISNATAYQPARIVGKLGGKPSVWTLR
ncbi:MAG TPA: hypothetical protein VES88_07870 [Gemmatimonadaceae bacterium]|nr:hypothetical protein [Gemmatimonadaceae bacterium]